MSGLTESTIVMVDDNVDEIFLTRRLVRKDGIVNRFVSEKKPENLFNTLNELEEMGVKRETFLILLDVNMPRVNGFEMLQRIRNDQRYAEIPVLMLSASDDVTDMFESFEHGSNGYLVKPFSGEEFFAAMENIPNIKKKLMQ